MADRKIYWRCFHCGDTFTKAQARWAGEHFGRDEGDLPVCQMRLPGEHHLLTALRNAQDELATYRAEDTDLMRAIYAMRADHVAALQREEDLGYEKGLADGRKYPAENGRVAAETNQSELLKTLKWYADQLCEFSPSDEGCGKFDDETCAGCKARSAIARASTPHPSVALLRR